MHKEWCLFLKYLENYTHFLKTAVLPSPPLPGMLNEKTAKAIERGDLMSEILAMEHITKTYPGVKALDDVSIS